MTEQRTEDYRDVLEDLARSRGMSGAEELAEKVSAADPTTPSGMCWKLIRGALASP